MSASKSRPIVMTSSLWRRLYGALVPNDSGCLLWTGPTVNGYGAISSGRSHWKVHRLVYELWVGSIPDGLDLDHLCRVRHCAAPDHLEPVTRRVNLLRGQTFLAANFAKTHCLRGHPFDLLNTRYRPNGKRTCIACADMRNKAAWRHGR